MTFYVGQKVVCVDKSRGFINMLGEAFDDPDLKLNAVYTVAWVGRVEDAPAVQICEIPRRRAPKGKVASNDGHPNFGAYRFRPLIERKTDISLFKAMLTPSMKERERV